MLIWRIAANCLPTKTNLARFFDIGDELCPLCKAEVESSIHLFTLCLVAKAFWFNSQWEVRSDALGFSSALELIQFLFYPTFLGSLSLDQRNEFLLFGATLYDGIWKLRNQVLCENLPLSIDDLSSRIGRLLAKFKNFRFAEMVSVRPTELLHAWSPLRRSLIKINVDAAVARDWRGGWSLLAHKR